MHEKSAHHTEHVSIFAKIGLGELILSLWADLELHFRVCHENRAIFETGLANNNPEEGHTIRKDSPEGLTCVYMCRKCRAD
jgi:hypothetical protein